MKNKATKCNKWWILQIHDILSICISPTTKITGLWGCPQAPRSLKLLLILFLFLFKIWLWHLWCRVKWKICICKKNVRWIQLINECKDFFLVLSCNLKIIYKELLTKADEKGCYYNCPPLTCKKISSEKLQYMYLQYSTLHWSWDL